MTVLPLDVLLQDLYGDLDLDAAEEWQQTIPGEVTMESAGRLFESLSLTPAHFLQVVVRTLTSTCTQPGVQAYDRRALQQFDESIAEFAAAAQLDPSVTLHSNFFRLGDASADSLTLARMTQLAEIALFSSKDRALPAFVEMIGHFRILRINCEGDEDSRAEYWRQWLEGIVAPIHGQTAVELSRDLTAFLAAIPDGNKPRWFEWGATDTNGWQEGIFRAGTKERIALVEKVEVLGRAARFVIHAEPEYATRLAIEHLIEEEFIRGCLVKIPESRRPVPLEDLRSELEELHYDLAGTQWTHILTSE